MIPKALIVGLFLLALHASLIWLMFNLANAILDTLYRGDN